MFSIFDTSRINILPLSERKHDLDLSIISPLDPVNNIHHSLIKTAKNIIDSKHSHSSVILMLGGHVLRSGVQRYLIDLMEKGYISCIAFNGAGAIHDYEFALIGKTTECVARYIKEGQFGLWKETAGINDIITSGSDKGDGFGEALGKAIEEGCFPHRDISIFAAAYRLRIPATVHVGIGYDIIHEHHNFNAEATGAASYRDFLIFAKIVQNLEKGVVANFGSAVMAPEVFLKALSMARNVAKQDGYKICNFTTLVCDLHDIPDDFSQEPLKSNAAYYFRPWKTMLLRTVADGGKSFYVKGNHNVTIPGLWTAINELENKS